MCRQRVVWSLLLVCTVAATDACSRRDASVRDSAADSTRQVAATTDPSGDWVSELGELLVVPFDSENAGIVLFPATPSPRLISSAPLTLLNAAGDSVVVRAALVVSDSQVCGEAPTVRLIGDIPTVWSVGLKARSVAVLRLDSIEALPSPDSVRLAAELARLASTIPMFRDSRFTGLPFVVLGARRFEAHGQEILVADLIRRLPQEATPLEERTFLIAERPASAKAEPYRVTHHQRSEGTEETAEHFEVLSAVRGSETVLLLLARDQEERTSYEILERAKAGGWRTRWSRALAC